MNRARLLCVGLLLLTACGRKVEAPPDHPRLTPNVTLRDVTFHSAALNRDMRYRAVFPAGIPAGRKLPCIYLLHGGGGTFRDWSNYFDVSPLAERGFVLIMPQGDYSYYTNSAARPQDRYEDYIVDDLIANVERQFPAAPGRPNRAIAGVSMGGFGALNLSLRHPDLFAFAGAISPAIDVPSRPFAIRRIGQWRDFRAIFGPWGGPSQRENDPLILARSADPAAAPYMFVSCGNQEGLLASNRQFADILEHRHFRYEFHIVEGGHNWIQFNRTVPSLCNSLTEHFHQ